MALDAILTVKRAEVAERQAAVPLERLLQGIAPSDRDFEAALRAVSPAFILEVKRASPSAGTIRSGSDLAPVLAAYAAHAGVISVLTDRTFFGGSFELLAEVRAAVTQPVLCKDFVLDPYQVVEARHHGADAVLLMLSVLHDADYRACAETAARLRMGALTEVHTEAELGRAIRLGARVIGVNNRDLRTLAVDLTTTRRLAPLVPAGPLVIAESGIGHRREVEALAPLVDGFLVGTALMRAADIGAATRELVFGLTKICGLRRAEDAALGYALGATHGGLMFAAESPRLVDPGQAERVRAAAALRWVGVFVNAPPREVADRADGLGLAAVQLHGEEPPEYVGELRPLLPAGCEVWKAVRVGTALPALTALPADRILLDSRSSARRGGTGQRFDWALLQALPPPDRERVVLSGGLDPENVGRASALGVAGLDVSSGVEAAPGVKSAERMGAFMRGRRGGLPTRGRPS